MSKWAKRIVLAVIVLLILLFLFNMYHKARSSDQSQSAAYQDYLQKQDSQSKEYMQRANAELARAKEVNDKSIQNQDRFEKLLQRWEKQADRYPSVPI